MKRIRAALFFLATSLAAVMAAVVAARMLFGAFHFGPVSVITPLNPEGFFGLAITLLLVSRTSAVGEESPWTGRTALLLALGVAAVSILALRKALGIYFLSDDFAVVKIGTGWTMAMFRYWISHGGGDGFYRPVGFLSLALDGRLGGVNPVVWHASSLAIHAANSVFVLFLARRMGASAVAAGFAGALFAVHGIHPEAAVWIDGRFDLLATFFLLAGLLLFPVSSKHDRGVVFTRHLAALAAFTLAAFSKEAAFVFPILIAGYVLWKKQPWRRMIPYLLLAAILFGYRWSLLGGIGGYVDRATGRPAALSLGLGSTLKAVAVRLWTSLYFPLNWSAAASLPLALPLALLAIAYMAALIWMALRSKSGRPVWPAAAALLISILPVLSLLAGSPSLAGARVLYLPSVWFAILLALAIDGLPARARYAVAAIVLSFQFAALQHNLGFWQAVSARVQAECARGSNDLPGWIDGVPALDNGKRECIEIGHTPQP